MELRKEADFGGDIVTIKSWNETLTLDFGTE